jgi:hypothetical protein
LAEAAAEAENECLAALFDLRPHWRDRKPIAQTLTLLQFRLRRSGARDGPKNPTGYAHG